MFYFSDKELFSSLIIMKMNINQLVCSNYKNLVRTQKSHILSPGINVKTINI